jgi:hypothetical protein
MVDRVLSEADDNEDGVIEYTYVLHSRTCARLNVSSAQFAQFRYQILLHVFDVTTGRVTASGNFGVHVQGVCTNPDGHHHC